MHRADRVVVVARPHDLADRPFDGFVTRHVSLIEAAAQELDVRIVAIRMPYDEEVLSNRLSALDTSEIGAVPFASTRVARTRRSVHPLFGGNCPWEAELVSAVAGHRPAVVVTVGPWLDGEFRALRQRFTTLHLFEEDLTAMAEVAPQSRRARALRTLLIWLSARVGATPKTAVAISEAERRNAERRYPRARTVCVPYGLDLDHWAQPPRPRTPGRVPVVVTVGALNEARNAEGLALVAEEVNRRWREPPFVLDIVSDGGLHPMLVDLPGRCWVRHDRPAGDVRDHYREADAVLVSARRATGVKTTILQGWASRRPVVAFDEAFSTLSPDSDTSSAVLAAREPSEVVDLLVRVTQDSDFALTATRAGVEHVHRHHDAARCSALFVDELARLTSERGS
jgi:hypothetical protein